MDPCGSYREARQENCAGVEFEQRVLEEIWMRDYMGFGLSKEGRNSWGWALEILDQFELEIGL